MLLPYRCSRAAAVALIAALVADPSRGQAAVEYRIAFNGALGAPIVVGDNDPDDLDLAPGNVTAVLPGMTGGGMTLLPGLTISGFKIPGVNGRSLVVTAVDGLADPGSFPAVAGTIDIYACYRFNGPGLTVPAPNVFTRALVGTLENDVDGSIDLAGVRYNAVTNGACALAPGDPGFFQLAAGPDAIPPIPVFDAATYPASATPCVDITSVTCLILYRNGDQVVLPASMEAQVVALERVLMIPDSTYDVIALFDVEDGALLDPDFIQDAGGSPYDFETPKNAIQVGGEIWVFDQVSDQIVRFDAGGAHVATHTGPSAMIDNVRGACFAADTVYGTNDGNQNGASIDSVVMFDVLGNRLGEFSVAAYNSSPFDVAELAGELLISEFAPANETVRWDYAGNALATFHASNGVSGIDSAEQITVTPSGDVLVAGYGSSFGIYRYDANGNQLAHYATGSSGCRGCFELDDGNLLFTDTTGVKVYDVATASVWTVVSGAGF